MQSKVNHQKIADITYLEGHREQRRRRIKY